MLKQGLFIDANGNQYTVYQQREGTFERMDFVDNNADFHVDIAAVKFSIVRMKGATFTYGDSAIWGEYNALKETASTIRAEEQLSHEWKLSNYHTTIVRSNPAAAFLEETVQINGRDNSYTISYKGSSFSLWTISESSQAKYTPLNFKDYEELSLEKIDVTQTDAPYYSLSVLKARYNIAHLDECDFVVADDLTTARDRLKRWLDADVRLKGVDTETTGVDVDLYGEDKLVGIILSYKYGEATYYPFAHQKFDNLGDDFLQNELMPAIKREEHREVAHNKKFERKVFLKQGWNIHIKYDTLPLSFMVNPIIQRGAHALKDLMFRATGKQFLELENIFVSPKLINFAVLPKEIVRLYACPDASSIIFLYDWLWNQLPVYSRRITEVEYDLADVKADQEYYGLRVDVKQFMKNLENCDYTLDMLLKAFRVLTKVDGNVNSNEVLSDLIFGKMHCPVLVRTKTGKPSTGAASIKKLASMKVEEPRENVVESDLCDLNGRIVIKASELNNAKYPALVVLEKYRIYNKLRTAFYSRFERTKKSGRVFFWVNQNGAASGRQSSPMHQLPGELKSIILSDSDDHDMWDPDYSQIELRMIAFLAGEKDLIKLCCDPGNDIHRAIGSLISGKEMWQISSEERKHGKRRNFGVVYLISAFGLAGQMFGPGYTKEQVAIAQQSLDDFYDRFKRIKLYIANNGRIVTEQGYITTWFGRNRYFKEILDPEITSKRKASLIRQANNLPVQGTAADYLKLAETNLATYIANKGWDALMPNGFPRVRVALSIHDELLVMADRSIPYEEICLMLRTCMEMPIEGAPPFFSSPALVDTWAQHDDDSVAMPVQLRDRLIKQYQETGVSQINKENYISVLNEFRESELQNYMLGLLQKCGKDAANLAAHVRHPSLTHELIARYPPPKGSKLSHEECILHACERYLEGDQAQTFIPSTKETEHNVMEDFSELSKLVNFDANGDVVYEVSDDADDEDIQTVHDDEHFINMLTTGEKVYVWELMDTLVIDISDLEEASANRVIQWVWNYRDPEGFFRVMFQRGAMLIDSKFRVEDIDHISLTKLIQEVHSVG